LLNYNQRAWRQKVSKLIDDLKSIDVVCECSRGESLAKGLTGLSKNHPVDNEVSTHLVRLIYHPRPAIGMSQAQRIERSSFSNT
jgi:hypothetical protein